MRQEHFSIIKQVYTKLQTALSVIQGCRGYGNYDVSLLLLIAAGSERPKTHEVLNRRTPAVRIRKTDVTYLLDDSCEFVNVTRLIIL